MSLWVNRTAGVAARNGTTTHTVAFTAATTGRLLVMVVAGDVTTAFPAGWTKRVSAVGNTELCVATKTAAASEASVVLTHNAANYPVSYVVYEFPAGTTWGISTTQSPADPSVAWNALAAVPANSTVMAALAAPVTAALTAASTVWTKPVEDIDSFTAFATTEGAYLTLASADAVTAGAYTPTFTVSQTGTPSAAGERVIFTLAPPTGGGNIAPTADAGPDQTVQATYTSAGVAGPTITLTGAASSDPDGTIASYAWTQTSGAAVTLSGTGATRTFTAPRFGGTLVFGLTVTDNSGAASTQDAVQVNVTGVGYGYVRVAGAWVKRPLFVRRSGVWDSTPSIPAGSYTTTYGATY